MDEGVETDLKCPSCRENMHYSRKDGLYNCDCGARISPEALIAVECVNERIVRAEAELEARRVRTIAIYEELLKAHENPEQMAKDMLEGQRAVAKLAVLRKALNAAASRAPTLDRNALIIEIMSIAMLVPPDVADALGKGGSDDGQHAG